MASEASAAKDAGGWRKNFRGKLMRVTRTSDWLRPNCEACASHQTMLCEWRATIRSDRRSTRLFRRVGGANRHVWFGSWLCKNTSARALTRRDLGDIAVSDRSRRFDPCYAVPQQQRDM